ncbi:MAG: lipoyl(octanoyl) transferase LipB [Thermoplasmata archaeon]|nr:lipoyl(octanoyl) transferase LipB [Thermoplasmata archaeon]
MSLAIRDWGTRPYVPALQEMRALRALRQRGEIPDTLLLVEHSPVVTVGVQGSDGETMPEGIPVVAVERGGKGTYHGPGQLVGYPIVDLNSRGRDVRRFVHEVESLLIQSLGAVGVTADRVAGRRGVWVGGERKIASVGIAVESWVTFHGFALNVSNDLAPFRAFHPCGLPGTVMTSVSEELRRPTTTGSLRVPVREAWEHIFGTPWEPPRAAPPGEASVLAR